MENKQPSITELKAMAYDRLLAIDQVRAELQQINQAIQQAGGQPTTETTTDPNVEVAPVEEIKTEENK